MKFIKPILLFSLLANLTLCFVVIKLFLKENNLFVKKPELIAKINNSTIAEDKIEFKKIVKEEFEIGMSEIELIKKLSRQGFNSSWSYKERPSSAVFVRSNIACNSIWLIIWEVDDFGNINKIDGQYRAGCL